MDKILIKDLKVRGVIGTNDWERDILQEILINIVIYHDLKKSGKTDNIDDTLNYRTITKDVINKVNDTSHYLVEALAEDIADICFSYGAKKVKVNVEKPGVLKFARSVSVGVEITRELDESKEK